MKVEMPIANDSADMQELAQLRTQIRDLAALLALPAMWRGRELPFIAGSLLDALISLLRLDFAYVRLEEPAGGSPLEDQRPWNGQPPAAIEKLLYETDHAEGVATVTHAFGSAPMRLVRFNSRLDRERGVVLVGSRRADFPTAVESFLLRIAVEQGMVALQSSRLLRDLKEANRAKSAFLATMSHELRTPLNAILGYVDLLEAGVSGDLNEHQRRNLGRVRAGSRHLLELIEGILAFARIDAGREEVVNAPVDLCDLATETSALIEPLARAQRIDFDVVLPQGPLEVVTDSGKVRQILLNLLSNAVKFTNEGSIQLEIITRQREVEIVVRDTGIGIAEDHLETIFEPFRQVGNVYTGKAAGTGLGLSVSRQLARLLRGDVTVHSVRGQGSAFTLRLPLQ